MKKRLLLFSLMAVFGIAASWAQQAIAKIGDKEYTNLQTAFYEANGKTVTLLTDVDATASMYASDSRFNLWVKYNMTIDGAGHTLTVKGRGIGVQGASGNIDVTFKNITIFNTASAARCIDTRGNISKLTLENCTLKTDGASGYTQPLTIGGNQSETAEVVINNSTIQTNNDAIAYYAITTFNPINLNATNSTIKGWANVYAKGQDSSAGSAGSTFTFDKCNLISSNAYSGVSNSFAMFVSEDNNITYNVTNSEVKLINTGDQKQAIGSAYSGGWKENVKINLGEGNNVIFDNQGTGSCEFAFNMNKTTSKLEVSGGTFNVEVPLEYCADGYVPVKNADGTYTVAVGVILDEAADNSGYDNQTTNVMLLRTIHGADETGSDVFNTFAVPFAVSAETMTDVFGTYKLYEFTGATFENEILTLNFDSKTAMEVGKAYLLSVSETKTNPAFGEVTISMNPVTTGEGSKATFIPVFSNTSGIGTGQDLVFLGANNTLYFAEQAADLKGFRGYFKLAEGVAASEVSMAFDGETTGISTVVALPTQQTNGAWYTIDGRQLNAQPTQKGIYIHNGKKVVVK